MFTTRGWVVDSEQAVMPSNITITGTVVQVSLMCPSPLSVVVSSARPAVLSIRRLGSRSSLSKQLPIDADNREIHHLVVNLARHTLASLHPPAIFWVVPVYRLPDRELAFPDPELAEEGGLLAVGGDLSAERLLTAYAIGIFPWYSEGDPILWWSPDPRLILEPANLRISRSLRKTMRREPFDIRADTAFERVIDRCRARPRPDQEGTWITPEMQEAYVELHRRGFAHSIEAWESDTLAGGLYGVSIGDAFFGESMFADRPDASKIAFVHLVRTLDAWGFDLIDCQVETSHLRRFGAVPMCRTEFLQRLRQSADGPTRRGNWKLPPLELS